MAEEPLKIPLCIGDRVPSDIAPYVRGQTIEVLVPKEAIISHCNGRMEDGEFRGYEILIGERLSPIFITHMGEPFELPGLCGKLSVKELAETYEDPLSFEALEVMNGW